MKFIFIGWKYACIFSKKIGNIFQVFGHLDVRFIHISKLEGKKHKTPIFRNAVWYMTKYAGEYAVNIDQFGQTDMSSYENENKFNRIQSESNIVATRVTRLT